MPNDIAYGDLLLVGRIGDRLYAMPSAAIERIERVVALTPLAEGPPGVIGLVNFRGNILPVVDPHPRLGLAAPPFHPDQHLVVIAAGSRYALRMDRVERILSAPMEAYEAIESAAERQITPFVVRLPGETLLVLSPQAFDPGHVVHALPQRNA